MFTLARPAIVPLRDWVAIVDALEKANAAVQAVQPIDVLVVNLWGDGADADAPSVRDNDAAKRDAAKRDAVAVQNLHRVVDVVIETLCAVAVREAWRPQNLRGLVVGQVDRLVVPVYRAQETQPPVVLDTLYATMEARPSWAQFLGTLFTLGVPAVEPEHANTPQAIEPDQPSTPQLPEREQEAAPQAVEPPPTGPFKRRAAWLKKQMQLAGITPNRLAVLGGPSGKSTKKILNGVDVEDHVLDRVVTGLTAAGRPVAFEDIPRD